MPVHNITASEFKTLRDTEKGSYRLIDVRSLPEWNAGHFEEAEHLPMHILPIKAAEALSQKDQKIVVYCLSGGRSSMVSALLSQMGYSNVYNLLGGYSGYSG